MTVSWEYYFQIALNKFVGFSIFSEPFELFMLMVLFIAGVFLIGIIHELYKSYKREPMIETLLFLLGMIALIPSNFLLILVSLCYSFFVLPDLAELLLFITLISSQFTYLCVNIFAIRVTFPKRYKIVLVVLLILSVITITTQYWATLQGPPYFYFHSHTLVYSLDIQIIRIFTLIPFGVIPISVFYYYAVKIREENQAKSNRSLWLGTGILCFSLVILMTTVASMFRIFQVLLIPAAIIFYICFSMPEWFKRRIGWT